MKRDRASSDHPVAVAAAEEGVTAAADTAVADVTVAVGSEEAAATSQPT